MDALSYGMIGAIWRRNRDGHVMTQEGARESDRRREQRRRERSRRRSRRQPQGRGWFVAHKADILEVEFIIQ